MAIGVGFFVIIATSLLLVTMHAADPAKSEQHEAPMLKFGYTGHTGPGSWGHLSPDFKTCATGKFQSPINILTKKVVVDKNLKPLKRVYSDVNATLVNHGFNVGVDFGNAGIWILDGKNYTLQQMHWHTPSEHMINGLRHDVELHLVHRTTDGNIAVIGIFYNIGQADPILAKMLKDLAMLAEEEHKYKELGQVPVGVFRAWRIKRNTHKYYRYIGSLTTPPCTENVVWHVLGEVRSISKEQIDALRAPLTSTCKTNSRPVQPLHGRMVKLYEGI